MTPKTSVPVVTFLLLGTALAACSFAPDYQVPKMPVVPLSYKEAEKETPKQPVKEDAKESGEWAAANPNDELPRGAWWHIYNDAKLNELEDKVTQANQDLKIAVAQYDQARAAAAASRADYFPTVTGNASGARQRQSTNVASHPSISHFNDFTFGADMSYEIDIWGRVRNAVTAANSLAEASKADLATVELSLHAELAIDYFALRGYDAMQVVLDRTVDADRKALQLTQDRLRGGIATQADADQAETQLQNALTQASDTRLQRAQLEHAIAVLIGLPPAAFNLPPAPLGDNAPPKVHAGMPSILLERRPDIASAERRTNAANAEIGVARAAWFPTFSLTGSIGFESAATSNWLTAPSQFWSLGPSALMTLFDAGKIDALTDEARAQYEAQAASYRQTVLGAYQEVEDNLAALHHLSDESKSQKAAAAAAKRSLSQETELYRGGAATFIDVSVAQTTALQAELAEINVRVRRLTASIQLVKALGGGWGELGKSEK